MPGYCALQANRHYRRYELPDKLTPEMVRGLLSDIRTDAIKRKVIRVSSTNSSRLQSLSPALVTCPGLVNHPRCSSLM